MATARHARPQDDRSAPAARRQPEDAPLAGVLERNIHALIEVRRRAERAKGPQERVADAITRPSGSMRFIYLHLVLFGAWIVVNLPWMPFRRFDPTLVMLASFGELEELKRDVAPEAVLREIERNEAGGSSSGG